MFYLFILYTSCNNISNKKYFSKTKQTQQTNKATIFAIEKIKKYKQKSKLGHEIIAKLQKQNDHSNTESKEFLKLKKHTSFITKHKITKEKKMQILSLLFIIFI